MQRITAYGGGVFKVNQEEWSSSIILTAENVVKWENAGSDESAIESLIEQLPSEIEILLIGTGERGEFISPALRQKVRAKTGAGIEVMDTGAACRTYNVLLAEGRQVVAALTLV